MSIVCAARQQRPRLVSHTASCCQLLLLLYWSSINAVDPAWWSRKSLLVFPAACQVPNSHSICFLMWLYPCLRRCLPTPYPDGLDWDARVNGARCVTVKISGLSKFVRSIDSGPSSAEHLQCVPDSSCQEPSGMAISGAHSYLWFMAVRTAKGLVSMCQHRNRWWIQWWTFTASPIYS